MKTRREFLKIAAAAGCATMLSPQCESAAQGGAPVSDKPNIVFILADDLGYGDIACLNPRGKIPTPNVDRLAAGGQVFTDAHSVAAVCTPSRYGILTGRYTWRSRLGQGIVGRYGKPLIAPERLTVPGFLKGHGYHTACFGKWHLGWNWPEGLAGSHADEKQATPEQQAVWRKVFSQPITGGPTTRGFDVYYGVDVPNWPPFCWIGNDRTVGIPSEMLPEKLLANNQASMPGPAVAGWKLERVLPTLADKACQYVKDRAADKKPFFLYLPLTSPHTPLAVNDEWRGRSRLNLYADYVMETDAVVGRVLQTLEANGLVDNTLVIFTSDNGCAPYIGVKDLEKMGHFPSAQFRGYKSDAWDGGHHIPFIARWPGHIRAGSTCAQMACQADLMATCADILGARLPDSAGEDSVSILPLLRGSDKPVRDHAVSQSVDGKFAIRDGQWKLLLCPGSGGWSKRDPAAAQEGLPLVQLYDMKADPGETTNLHAKYPERVKAMVAWLKKLVADGRSTPGPQQQNDAQVDIWKLHTMPGVDASRLDDY